MLHLIEVYRGKAINIYALTLGGCGYDDSPDGQRFPMLKEVVSSEDTSTSPDSIIVQNWFEELRRLVPTN